MKEPPCRSCTSACLYLRRPGRLPWAFIILEREAASCKASDSCLKTVSVRHSQAHRAQAYRWSPILQNATFG